MKQQSLLNRLQTRQMILVTAVMVPILVGLMLFVTSRAESLLETAVHERLSSDALALADSDLSKRVRSARLGDTGYAFLVDAQGQVMVHPDPSYAAASKDLSAVEPVAKVLTGYTGSVEYVDAEGVEWLAFVRSLDDGWGLVIQQEASEVWGPLQTFERMSWLGLLLAISITLALTYWVTRRTLKPVRQLTAAAMAVAQGDLSQKVPLEGGAELKALAQAFNTMTEQVQDLVANLGNLVAERTAELAQLDSAIDCTGLKTVIEFLMSRTRHVVTIFGVLREVVEFTPQHWSGLTLMGYGSHNFGAAERALRLVRDGKLSLAPLVTKRLPLSQYADGVELLSRKEATKICYLPWE